MAAAPPGPRGPSGAAGDPAASAERCGRCGIWLGAPEIAELRQLAAALACLEQQRELASLRYVELTGRLRAERQRGQGKQAAGLAAVPATSWPTGSADQPASPRALR